MFTSTRRHRHHSFEIWPGFVDALATLLMVITFVLMTFVVAQLFLSDTLSHQNQSLSALNEKLSAMTKALGEAHDKNDAHVTKNINLEKTISQLNAALDLLRHELLEEQTAKMEVQEKSHSLSQKVDELSAQIKKLLENLVQHDTENKTLKNQMSEKDDELDALRMQADKNKGLIQIAQYRSEFFAKLKQAIGNRSDIRVVGDRFVFQSELFFEKGSADLGEMGKKQLDQLAKALKEIISKIPDQTPWILRVDGHTDQLPIHTKEFPSNWELSVARALSVVRYLIKHGIDPSKLVAAGFGEHQPLSASADEGKTPDQARNRRIAFKLDHP